MDFIDKMHSDNMDVPMLDYGNVYAEFFEKAHAGKSFQTIKQLLEHCEAMVK